MTEQELQEIKESAMQSCVSATLFAEVERLREENKNLKIADDVLGEEIIRQNWEIERLRAALEEIANVEVHWGTVVNRRMREIARQALSEEDGD